MLLPISFQKRKKMKKQNKKVTALPQSEFYGTASVGTKGQIVIPNEARKKFNIKAGDQLVIFGGENGVLAVMKSEMLNDLLNGLSKHIPKI